MTRTPKHFFALAVAIIGLLSVPLAQAQSLPGPSATAALPGAGTIAPEVMHRATPAEIAAAASVGEAEGNYRLGTGDKMKVTVYGEDDMSGEFLVDGTGHVQLPLVGQVNAAGLTIAQFVASLTQTLGSQYLKDPKISVQILNYRPFYIMGEVNRPGEYPFENSLTVVGAIALAGGYTYRANDAIVYIRRSGSDKEEQLPISGATRVFPGDVVRVKERFF